MGVPVPEFNLDGLEGEELENRILEILKQGIAEGDTTVSDSSIDDVARRNQEAKLEQRAIDLYGREAWEDAIKKGKDPIGMCTIKSAGCIGSSGKFDKIKSKKVSMIDKLLLKMKLAKEVKQK